MALSEDQREQIRILISTNYKTDDNPNGLSNRAIAKEVQCSESAVRTLIKKENPPKNAINALVKKQVDSTITANQNKNAINALNPKEKNAANALYIDYMSSLNTFNNGAMENQSLFDDAQQEIVEYIAEQKKEATANGKKSYAAIEQLPNILAISKGREQNRKQVVGVTQTQDIDSDEDKPKVRKYIIRKKDD